MIIFIDYINKELSEKNRVFNKIFNKHYDPFRNEVVVISYLSLINIEEEEKVIKEKGKYSLINVARINHNRFIELGISLKLIKQ